MIKAASSFLSFTLLFAVVVPGPLRADPNAADVSRAADEAVRRQADTKILREKLVAAQAAQQRRDLDKAAKLYENCYTLVQHIGPSVEAETRQTVAGLSAVLMDLAHEAQQRQDYNTADKRVSRVLVIDPNNPAAIDCKRENDRLMAAQAGTIPSRELLDRIPSFRTNEIRIATMVQDGKLLYEAGRLEEAEAKLLQAYKEDPQNLAAHHYLELIGEKRAADATRRAERASREGLLQVEKAWDVPLRAEAKQAPNWFDRTNLVYTSKGRQAILSKLDRIHIDTVKYDGMALTDVINNLNDLARSRDPDKIGINFFINRETPPTPPAAPGGTDPATGLPIAPLPTETVDVGNVTVKIVPALSDVRLADVLDAITKASDKPIKFSIEDYAVVFSLKAPEPVQMYSRVFQVDPNTFKQGLEGVSTLAFADIQLQNGGTSGSSSSSSSSGSDEGSSTVLTRVNVAGGNAGGGRGGGGGNQNSRGLDMVTGSNQVAEVQMLVRNFFIAAGVDLNPANPANANKSIFFNDRKGTLLVHSTAADLDIIAAAVEALNQAPPQVNIKSKFVEITQNDNRALGFDWYLGNVLLGGGRIAGSGGTQPSMNAPGTAANPGDPVFNNSTFPGNGTAGTTIPPSTTDGLLTSGLRNTLNAPAVATFTGLLTDPQFRVAIKALEQRDGVDLMTAPEITTTSGRQAQMQAVDIQAIVTGNQFQNQNTASFAGTQSGVNAPIVQQPIQIQPATTLLPFGPVLDVIPYVSADQYSIQMTIIPTVTEFIGYDDPGQFVLTAQQAGQSVPITAQLPLPHFRLRQVVTSATVWDSQTIVIGGLITDSVTKIKDKIPLLGDMPFIGRLFRSESSSKSKKNLLIFVTPTIINPDGTRYHSDEEMPFAQSSYPSQKSVTQ